MYTTINNDIKKQLDNTLLALDNEQTVEIYLVDLIQMQQDVAEIKSLLFNGTTKFVTLGVKLGSLYNQLKSYYNI